MKTIYAALDVFDATNSGRKHRSLPDEWCPAFVLYLVSAVSNKQRLQARCASAKSANWSEDSSCRLCRKESGTLQHRHSCSALWTTPLPPPQPKYHHPAMACTSAQTELWRTRGIGAARIFIKKCSRNETVEWVRQLSPRADTANLTWYVDASQVDAEVEGMVRFGYAGDAVNEAGELEATFRGIPPRSLKPLRQLKPGTSRK